MAPVSARTLKDLHDVLPHFGINATEIRDIRTGRVNKHWRVVAGSGLYALRRYTPQRRPAAIRYEHEVLRHAQGRGWPVAAPLPPLEGPTLVRTDSSWFALFPFLAGRPGPSNSLRYLRIKGGLLARLHHDLASWRAPGQRDGFARVWDLDAYVCTSDFQTFDDMLRAFGDGQPRIAEMIRMCRRANLEELASLGYESLPDTLVHADFHRDNVLFQRGRLSALLDFDLVHIDARAADIATSIALDCLEPPAYTSIDPDAVQAFVAGYADESSLNEIELRLIVPLVRAQILWLCAFGLSRWAAGEIDIAKATRSLTRSATGRLPSLAARAQAIENAVRAAAR